MTRRDIGIGIALGGGGSRALTHLGVLCALAEAGLKVEAVAGSSLGAVIGAMYAFQPDAFAIRESALAYFQNSHLFGRHPRPARSNGLEDAAGCWRRLRKYLWTAAIANIIAVRRSLLRRNPAFQAIADLVPDRDISEAQIPFACNALDLTRGALITFTAGPVRQALMAGTAVGVVFPPWECNGTIYVDAAPVSSVPVRACRDLGARLVIAVDVRTPAPATMTIDNGYDVISRIESVESRCLNDAEIASAEIVLRPALAGVFWGDFTRCAEVVAAGEQAAREALPEIRRQAAAATTPSP